MNGSPRVDDEFESYVDSMCDRFEAELREGQQPQIEDCLQGLEGDRRALLLRELLLVELDVLGSPPADPDYSQRFPHDVAVLEQALSEFAASRLAEDAGTDSPRDDTTILGSASTESRQPIFVGDQIGDYQVQHELGRGGMGVVYQARQRSTNRIVALKVIRTDQLDGQSSRKRQEIIERFKNEAQAAAALDHDHIVTVFDIGEADGQHYYSMKFVAGRGLDELVAEVPLACREAAAYLEPVVRAVHEAHQLGIVHRDIKPSNILIESKSNRALVTDFGLAKLQMIGQSLTATGTLFGSPPYMSPEQIIDSGKVGVTTDVYGFGATLYHMIAGRAPFQAASAVETIQQVLHEHAPAPRLLNSSIDRDLETICVKCLEKDTRRRYGTASELADDLRRYLNREPITARPVSTAERMWRWCGRNRMVASVVSFAAAVLVLATLVATQGYVNATRALAREEEQRHIAEERRQAALRSFELARNAIEQNVELITSNPVLRTKGLEKLRRNQLQIAQTFFLELLAEAPDDLDLLAAQARGYDQLARIQLAIGELLEAREAFDKALDLRARLVHSTPDILQLQADLADTQDGCALLFEQLGLLEDAERMSRQAFDVRNELARRDQQNAEYQKRLAESHAHLGAIHVRNGELESAVTAYQQALHILDRTSNETAADTTHQIAVLRVRIRLARLAAISDRLSEAQQGFVQARDLATLVNARESENSEAQEMLATAQSGLANVYHRAGEFKEAESTYLTALGVIEQLTQTHPDVVNHRRLLATCLNNLASLYEQAGRAADAEQTLVRALAITQSIVELIPHGVDHQNDLAIGLLDLGNLYAGAGKRDEAERMLRESHAAFQAMSAKYPAIPDYQEGVVTALSSQAKVVMLAQRFSDAEHDLLNAMKLCRNLVDANQRPDYHRRLAATHVSLGTLYASTARAHEAEENFNTAIAILDRLIAKNPSAPVYRFDLAIARFNLSMLLQDEAKEIESEQEAEASLRLLQSLVNGVPGNAEYLAQLADLHDHLAHFNNGNAMLHLRAATETWGRLYELTSVDSYLLLQAKGSNSLADHLLGEGDQQESANWYGRGIAALLEVQTLRVDDDYVRHLLRSAYASRAEVHTQLANFERSVEDWTHVAAMADDDQRGTFELVLGAAHARAGDFRACLDTVKLAIDRDADNLEPRWEGSRVLAAAALQAKDPRNGNDSPSDLHDELLTAAVELIVELQARGFLAERRVQETLREAAEFVEVRKHARIRPLLE